MQRFFILVLVATLAACTPNKRFRDRLKRPGSIQALVDGEDVIHVPEDETVKAVVQEARNQTVQWPRVSPKGETWLPRTLNIRALHVDWSAQRDKVFVKGSVQWNNPSTQMAGDLPFLLAGNWNPESGISDLVAVLSETKERELHVELRGRLYCMESNSMGECSAFVVELFVKTGGLIFSGQFNHFSEIPSHTPSKPQFDRVDEVEGEIPASEFYNDELEGFGEDLEAVGANENEVDLLFEKREIEKREDPIREILPAPKPSMPTPEASLPPPLIEDEELVSALEKPPVINSARTEVPEALSTLEPVPTSISAPPAPAAALKSTPIPTPSVVIKPPPAPPLTPPSSPVTSAGPIVQNTIRPLQPAPTQIPLRPATQNPVTPSLTPSVASAPPKDSEGSMRVSDVVPLDSSEPLQSPNEEHSFIEDVQKVQLKYPNQSIGTHAHGSLRMATNLQSIVEKMGEKSRIRLIHPEQKRFYGNYASAEFLFKSSVLLDRLVKGTFLEVGDISSQNGGRLRPHKSHQNGLDMDVGFFFEGMQSNYYGRSVLAKKSLSSQFDRRLHWQFFKSLMTYYHDKIYFILLHPYVKKAMCEEAVRSGDLAKGKEIDPIVSHTLRRLVSEKSHYNHFHVRLKCPAKDSRCVQTTRDLPLATGCFKGK